LKSGVQRGDGDEKTGVDREVDQQFPAACMHVVVKHRLAARKQQHNLFAPVRSSVLGNEGPMSLNVELAWLGSIPRIVFAPHNKVISSRN
jgi:hypothetical protein